MSKFINKRNKNNNLSILSYKLVDELYKVRLLKRPDIHNSFLICDEFDFKHDLVEDCVNNYQQNNTLKMINSEINIYAISMLNSVICYNSQIHYIAVIIYDISAIINLMYNISDQYSSIFKLHEKLRG